MEIPLKRTNQSQKARRVPFFGSMLIVGSMFCCRGGLLIGVASAVVGLGKTARELLTGVGPGGGLGRRLFGRGGDAEAHEEETKAFAEGIDETHGATFPGTLSEYRVRKVIDLPRPAGQWAGGWGHRRAGLGRG